MRKKTIPFNNTGFTLVEVLMATIILAIAIVPVVYAFRSAITSTGVGERLVVFTTQAASTLSRAAAHDYDILHNHRGDPVNLAGFFGSEGEANREKFTFRGTVYTPAISIADASGGAGGLLEITVTIEEINLKTLKSNF